MTVREDPSSNRAGSDKNPSGVQSSSASAAAATAPAREKSAASSGVIPAPASPAKGLPGMEKLGAGIREMVEAELQAAGLRVGKLEDKAAKPGRWDVVFLLVGVVNLTLLVWMIPGDILKDERIKFLKDLVPWVFGSLFVLVTSWYHETILTLSRNRIFRIVDVVLLVVLAGLTAPVVAIPPVLPQDAHLRIDDEKAEPRDLTRTHRVSLFKEHIYYLEKDYGGKEPYKRPIKMTGWGLWNEKRSNSQLSWSLFYPVTIKADRAGIKLTIRRNGSVFDQDFLRSENLDSENLARSQDAKGENDNVVQFSLPNGIKIAATHLPIGSYRLRSESSGCTAKVCDKKAAKTADPEGCNAQVSDPESLTIDPKNQPRYTVDVMCQ